MSGMKRPIGITLGDSDTTELDCLGGKKQSFEQSGFLGSLEEEICPYSCKSADVDLPRRLGELAKVVSLWQAARLNLTLAFLDDLFTNTQILQLELIRDLVARSAALI